MILYLIPLIAALTGLLFHWLLTSWLFRMGLPSRLPALLSGAGNYLGSQVVRAEAILEKITDQKNLEAVKPYLEEQVNHFLKHKLPEKMPMIAMFAGAKTLDAVKDGLMEEMDTLLPGLLQQYAGRLKEELNLEKMIQKQLSALPPQKVAGLIRTALKKEIGLFISLGALTGLLIGALSLLLMMAAS
jgi:uncharacterized membrane protein YheB (UPF0754 family)